MYPMERYMKSLKTYVQNMARAEGSMVEGYKTEEAIGFCIEYMQNFKTKKCQIWDFFRTKTCMMKFFKVLSELEP
jgi:hypothetical protein